MDVELEVKQVLRNPSIQFHLVHVYAHRDDHKSFDELPLDAQLNGMVDENGGGTLWLGR